jgi:hypothetical protein
MVYIPGAPDSFKQRYAGGAIWGTETENGYDVNAQQVEFQIEDYRPENPSADSTLTVHGVSFQQIIDTQGLIGRPIVVMGGMRDGLPLATLQARKRGKLVDGLISQAWGNWIGTDMSIGMKFVAAGVAQGSQQQDGGGSAGPNADVASGNGGGGASAAGVMRARRTGFRSLDGRPYARGAVSPLGFDRPVVRPTGIGDIGELGTGAFGSATTTSGGMTASMFGGGLDGLQAPLNLIHNLQPNASLSSAIKETLSKAFPNGKPNVQISDALKLPYQDAGMYQNLQQYASYIKNLSHSVLGIKDYTGVNFSSHSNVIDVWDITKNIAYGQIDVIDLIGQPTWIDLQTVSVKTILRGDLHVGSDTTIPSTLINIAADAVYPASPSFQKTHITLPGKYRVIKVLHIGDFRNPDGAGWSTNFELLYLGGAGSGQADLSRAIQDSTLIQNPNNLPSTPLA